MKTRILTSLVGVPLILVLLFWPGGWPWFWFVAALMAMAIYEFTKGLWAKAIYVHWVALAIFGGCLLVNALATVRATPSFLGPWLASAPLAPESGLWNRGLPNLAALLAMTLLASDLVWKRRSPLKNLGATFVGIAWLMMTLPFLVQLRRVGDDYSGSYLRAHEMATPPFHVEEGAWLMLAVLLVIWAGDSGAYFVGKSIGKHKMAPAISPNKTWEGAIGGLAASWLIGFVMTWTMSVLPVSTCWVFGLVVGAAGQVGDLVESAIKREIGIKDFGDLLPGHGGVLDRFDSLLFAAPVALCILYPDGIVRFLR